MLVGESILEETVGAKETETESVSDSESKWMRIEGRTVFRTGFWNGRGAEGAGVSSALLPFTIHGRGLCRRRDKERVK